VRTSGWQQEFVSGPIWRGRHVGSHRIERPQGTGAAIKYCATSILARRLDA
jgi:hypothetical protein